MQTFSFKTAKLTSRARVEVDRRWVRAEVGSDQTHIDFNQIDTIHYWMSKSRGAALTGRLVIRDRQARTLALQCSSFGIDRDFVEFAGAVSATLTAIGEARPDLRVAHEPTARHRRLMAGLILLGFIAAAAASYALGPDDPSIKLAGAGVGLLLVIGLIVFRYGPLRRRKEMLAPFELARSLSAQVAAPAGAIIP